MGSAHRSGQWVVGQSAKPQFPWSWLDYYYSGTIGVNAYAILETYGNTLTLTGYKLLEEDEVLDSFTIVKSGAGLSKGDPSKQEQTDTPPAEPENPPAETPDPSIQTPNPPAEPAPSPIRGLLWIVLGCVSAAAVGVLVYAGALLAKRKKRA
jgi:hypothetical protein